MNERDPALEPFGLLIGTWATEATHSMFDGVVPGSMTFEWLERGRFIVQRSRNQHEAFPDAICVIGPPEDGGGDACEGLRELARTPGDWKDDLKMAYRRA